MTELAKTKPRLKKKKLTLGDIQTLIVMPNRNLILGKHKTLGDTLEIKKGEQKPGGRGYYPSFDNTSIAYLDGKPIVLCVYGALECIKLFPNLRPYTKDELNNPESLDDIDLQRGIAPTWSFEQSRKFFDLEILKIAGGLTQKIKKDWYHYLTLALLIYLVLRFILQSGLF
jgi:hypothetical protein